MSDYLDSCDVGLSQGHFYRMFALGCFDSFVTLPITVTNLASNIVHLGPLFNFYQGWVFIHSNWGPGSVPKSVWSTNKWTRISVYWNEWINPFFALAFFLLFGLSPEALKGYRRLFRFLGRPFGARQIDIVDESLPEVAFKSGRGTSATITSNISSRYVRIPSSAMLFNLNSVIVPKQMPRHELSWSLDEPTHKQ